MGIFVCGSREKGKMSKLASGRSTVGMRSGCGTNSSRTKTHEGVRSGVGPKGGILAPVVNVRRRLFRPGGLVGAGGHSQYHLFQMWQAGPLPSCVH